jgi:hypothetical protein
MAFTFAFPDPAIEYLKTPVVDAGNSAMVKPDGDLQVHEGSDVEPSEQMPAIVVPSTPAAATTVPMAIAAAYHTETLFVLMTRLPVN